MVSSEAKRRVNSQTAASQNLLALGLEINPAAMHRPTRLITRSFARQLHAEVLDLKQGIAAIEERARHDLGMVKPNETFYQLVED